MFRNSLRRMVRLIVVSFFEIMKTSCPSVRRVWIQSIIKKRRIWEASWKRRKLSTDRTYTRHRALRCVLFLLVEMHGLAAHYRQCQAIAGADRRGRGQSVP